MIDLGPGESPHDSLWRLEIDGPPQVFIGDLVYSHMHPFLADGFTINCVLMVDAHRLSGSHTVFLTARPLQRYDHRLRELVERTRTLKIATDLGVPRSTARTWLRAAPTVVVRFFAE